MNPLDLKRLFPHASKSCLARNAADSVGAVENPKRQPNQRSEEENRGLVPVQTRLGYRVTIISLRKRLVDGHDNLRTGAKPLVDRITDFLGFRDDSDSALSWEYAQVKTTGQEGTVVVIEATSE